MIQIEHVSKWYGDFHVLKDCSTNVDKGEVVVVCGPSGSGKSTLIKCVNGLEPFQEGMISVNGTSVGDSATNLPKLRSHIGMVFQNFELFPHITVTQNINLGQVKVLNRAEGEATERSMALLERVGLSHRLTHRPAALSGGERQRVAVARALINRPSLLLCDEPTGSLDHKNAEGVAKLLFELHGQEKNVLIVVTHSLELARSFERRFELSEGRCIER